MHNRQNLDVNSLVSPSNMLQYNLVNMLIFIQLYFLVKTLSP